MSLEGYTGATSGRITVGGGKPTEVQRFYDDPLTEDELKATADFRAMSPNEQIREYRRLKWNENVFRQDANAWKDACQKRDAEITSLKIRLARYTPDGYKFPVAAVDLLEFAKSHGWKTDHAWDVRDHYGMQDAMLNIVIASGEWVFQLSWICDPGGTGRMFRSGLARSPGRDWYDAPSLKKIKEIIETVSEEKRS